MCRFNITDGQVVRVGQNLGCIGQEDSSDSGMESGEWNKTQLFPPSYLESAIQQK